MRVSGDIIKREGERVSPHSKFYVWEDKLFEPVYYRGKKCKNYKPITSRYRIRRIMSRRTQVETIPTVSTTCGIKAKKKNIVHKKDSDRFELLDL